MNNSFKYPTRYELEQALGEFCKRNFLDHFAQSRGVFITGAVQNDLAKVLSRLFYEHVDLEEIRKAAFYSHSKTTISGFLVQSRENSFNLLEILDEQRGNVVDEKKDMCLGQFVKLELGKTIGYRGSVEYKFKKPGRIEFLQEDFRSFDYFVYEIEPWNWKVIVECNRSTDSKVMEDWIKKIGGRDTELFVIDQSFLTSIQTVAFFDTLATRGMGKDWHFTKVKHLIFRKGDDDEEEAGKSELSGITQAILDGNDLRDNPFVKQSEESGYRFTAMTYEFEHKKEPHILQIRAEFKGRPKVFEVELKSSKKRVGKEENLEDCPLKDEEEMKICADFWTNAKKVFDELKDEQPSKPVKRIAYKQ